MTNYELIFDTATEYGIAPQSPMQRRKGIAAVVEAVRAQCAIEYDEYVKDVNDRVQQIIDMIDASIKDAKTEETATVDLQTGNVAVLTPPASPNPQTPSDASEGHTERPFTVWGIQ